ETAAADARVVALCNFEFRCSHAREALREVVASGELGTVERVQWTVASAGSRVPVRWFGWLFDAQYGGGWVGAWGSHAIDAVRFVFGEGVDVTGTRSIGLPMRPDRDGVEHEGTAEGSLAAVLRLGSGGA